MSSSQNECTLGGGGARKRKRANKGGGGSKLGNLERTYFLNVPLWNFTLFIFLVQKNSLCVVIRNPRVNDTGLKNLFSRICEDMVDKSGDVAWYMCRTSY